MCLTEATILLHAAHSVLQNVVKNMHRMKGSSARQW